MCSFITLVPAFQRLLRLLMTINNSEVLLVTTICHVASSLTPLYILGLYPMSGSWPGGQGQLPATKMGIEHVNANESLLPGFELVLINKDTQVGEPHFVPTATQKNPTQPVSDFVGQGLVDSAFNSSKSTSQHDCNTDLT